MPAQITEAQRQELFKRFGVDPSKFDVVDGNGQPFEVVSEPPPAPVPPKSIGKGETMARALGMNALPATVGTLAGLGALALAPQVTIPAVLGSMVVGGGVGMGAEALQNKVGENFDWYKNQEELNKLGHEQNPKSALVGDLAAQGISMAPGLGMAKTAVTSLPRALAGKATANELRAIGNTALGNTIGGGLEAGSELYNGEQLSPSKIAISAAGGALFNDPRKWSGNLAKKFATTVRPSLKTSTPNVSQSQVDTEPIVSEPEISEPIETLVANPLKRDTRIPGFDAVIPKGEIPATNVEMARRPGVDVIKNELGESIVKPSPTLKEQAGYLKMFREQFMGKKAMPEIMKGDVSETKVSLESGDEVVGGRLPIEPKLTNIISQPNLANELNNSLRSNQIKPVDSIPANPVSTQQPLANQIAEMPELTKAEAMQDLADKGQLKTVPDQNKYQPTGNIERDSQFDQYWSDLAAKHKVTLENDSNLAMPDGTKVAGAAYVQARLAKINPTLAGLDTAPHEIGHIFLNDLVNADDAVSQNLARRGIELSGSEEKLIENVGIRAVDLTKARFGNDASRFDQFKNWLDDFWSNVKQKFGAANEQDIQNLLARRMLDDKPSLPTQDGPLTDTQKVYYSKEAKVKASELTSAASTELAEKDKPLYDRINNTVFGFMQDMTTRLANFAGREGRYLAHTFTEWAEIRKSYIGKYYNPSIDIVNELSKNERDMLSRYATEIYENGKASFVLPANVNDAYIRLSKVLADSGREASVAGPRVRFKREDGTYGYRERELVKGYWPTSTMDMTVRDVISNRPSSVDGLRLKQEWIDYNAAKHFKGNKESAESAYNEFHSAAFGNLKSATARFAGNRIEVGSTMPPGWREKDLGRLFSRYFMNYADDMAYHRAIETSDLARGLLDLPDDMGNKKRNTLLVPATEKGGILQLNRQTNNDDVKGIMKFINSDFDNMDLTYGAAARLQRANMLQTITGLIDVTSSVGLAMPYVPAREWHNLFKALFIKNLEGQAMAKRTGSIYSHSIGLRETQLPAGSLTHFQQMANSASDMLNKYTGRELFENMARAVPQIGGYLTALNEFDRVLKGDPTAIKFMRNLGYMFPENIVLGVRNNPEKLKLLAEEVGSKLTDLSQGTYDFRELPKWAMTGPLSAMFALMKWNIGRFNTFNKTIVRPLAVNGDWEPLLKATVGAVMTAPAVQYIRESVSGKTANQPTVQELLNSDQARAQDFAYTAVALMDYSSFAGLGASAAKAAFDVAYGAPAQGPSMQVVDLATEVVDVARGARQALQDGYDPAYVGTQAIKSILKAYSQVWRLGERISNIGDKDAQHELYSRNERRNQRVFKYMHGYPVSDIAGNYGTSLDKEAQQFKRTTDPMLAQELLSKNIYPRLANQYANKPEILSQRLRGLRSNNYQTLPNPQNNPMLTQQYLDYYERVFGTEAKRKLVEDYIKQNAVNKYKSGLVPRL